jgi:hypothetical protein
MSKSKTKKTDEKIVKIDSHSLFQMNMMAFTKTIDDFVEENLLIKLLALEIGNIDGDVKLYIAILYLQLRAIPIVLRMIRDNPLFDYKTDLEGTQYQTLIEPYFQGMCLEETIRALKTRLVQIPYLIDKAESGL